MTVPAESRRNPLMATLTTIAAVADALLAAIGMLMWSAERSGHLTSAQAATFTLLGASATAGTLVLLIAAIAFARGAPGYATARIAAGLAVLRIGVVVVALIAIAIGFGSAAFAGSFAVFGAAIAVAETCATLFVTQVAVRRTHHA